MPEFSIKRTASEVANEDLRDLMRCLGMSLHARPDSPHEVFQTEVLPRVRQIQTALREAAQAARYVPGDNTYTISAAVYDIVREALRER